MEITKDKLKELYENKTNDEVCKILKISKVTLVKYIKNAGIKQKGKGGGLSSNKITVID